MSVFLGVIAALLLDALLGEPKRAHPLVAFGRLADRLRKEEEKEEALLRRERRMQETTLDIKRKFGKNALLKGLDFAEGATTRQRNMQIGGHKA